MTVAMLIAGAVLAGANLVIALAMIDKGKSRAACFHMAAVGVCACGAWASVLALNHERVTKDCSRVVIGAVRVYVYGPARVESRGATWDVDRGERLEVDVPPRIE